MMLSNISEGNTVVYELQKGKEKQLCMGYKRVDGAILEAKQPVGRRDVPLMARDRKYMSFWSFCHKLTSRILF